MSSIPEPAPIARRSTPRADGLIVHRNVRWSFAHIALWSGFEYNYVVNVFSVRSDFPRPIRITPGTGHPRYISGEIMDWFDKHQEL